MLPLLYVLLISYLFPVRTLGLREGAGEESVLTLRLVSDGGRALQTCSKLSDSMIEFQRKPRHKERQPPFNIALVNTVIYRQLSYSSSRGMRRIHAFRKRSNSRYDLERPLEHEAEGKK